MRNLFIALLLIVLIPHSAFAFNVGVSRGQVQKMIDEAISGGGTVMVYPAAGVGNSTGTAWGTSYTVGTAAYNLVQLDASGALPVVSAENLTNLPTAVTLGLEIGVDVQAYDADLTSYATVTPSANALSFISAADYAAMRTALGLGTVAVLNHGTAVGDIVRIADAGGGLPGLPFSLLQNYGTTLPATCTIGETFFDTDADIDGDLYICRATDTWKAIDDDGGAGGMATTDIDTSAKMRTIVTDESGTGAMLFAGGNIGEGIATTPSAGDNDTSIATTAYVQTEIVTTQTGTHSAPSTTATITPTWSGLVHAVWVGITMEIDLPAVANYAGKAIMIYNTGVFDITVDPNGTEVIVRDGTVQSAGISFTLSSGAGNYVGLYCDGVRWITLGYKGTIAVGT